MSGVGTLLMCGLVVIQMVVFIVWPPPVSVVDWFSLFQNNRLLGLLSLDLLLVADSVIMIPMYLAFFVALRRTNDSLITLATALGLISVTTFFASNPAFNMLTLSNQYASASSEAQRSILLAAGQTVLAMSNGTAFNVYYLLGSVAPIIICAVMLRSRLFGKATAIIGIVANAIALGLYVPTIGLYLSLFSVVGLEVWFFMVGLRFLSLGQFQPKLV